MIDSVLLVMYPIGSDVSRLVAEYNIKAKEVIVKVTPVLIKLYLVKPRAP